MAKCNCSNRPKIVSNVVRNMDQGCCQDVCVDPICGDPKVLSMMTPLIYDEIGINLCTSFSLGENFSTTYPNAVSATVQVLDAAYECGAGAGKVEINSIAGRPNCTSVTLSNINVTFACTLYDCSNRVVGTVYPTAMYLPTDTTPTGTYDEDTNPSSVELEIFTPYGCAYKKTTTTEEPPVVTLTPAINFIGMTTENNVISQGINMYCYAKLLGLNVAEGEVTVGLTLILQSVYFAGYKAPSLGKIDTPKGSIIAPDNSDCMRFVAGDLLNLAIKPLDLGCPFGEENMKEPCADNPNGCTNIVSDSGTGPIA